jgi:hypothetical protein
VLNLCSSLILMWQEAHWITCFEKWNYQESLCLKQLLWKFKHVDLSFSFRIINLFYWTVFMCTHNVCKCIWCRDSLRVSHFTTSHHFNIGSFLYWNMSFQQYIETMEQADHDVKCTPCHAFLLWRPIFCKLWSGKSPLKPTHCSAQIYGLSFVILTSNLGKIY